MAKLADADIKGSTSGGKQTFNKSYQLTTTQLLIGAVVLYLMF